MVSTAAQMRNYKGASFFSFGFRPFFFGGALIAAVLPALTALAFIGAVDIGAPYGIVAYHGHEMVYGYLGAVVAGFILTAVPNWTGRLPVMGARLLGLFSLWAAGRLSIALAELIGVHATAVVDALFLVVVDIIIWREVITGKNWRNLPVCIALGLFAAGNVLWHIDVVSGGAGQFGLRWGVAVIAILLALIGGRVTPSFTRNWLAKTGGAAITVTVRLIDKLALGMIGLAMAAWLIAPAALITGSILIIAAGLHLVRLLRWQGWRTAAEPLVAILHIGYLWLSISLLLLGLSAIAPNVIMLSTAVHALTAGAAGVMTLAVMTRATLGHTGRALRADKVTIVIYCMVNLGAALRLAAPLALQFYSYALLGAGILWGAAFLLFAAFYGPYLFSRKIGET